MGKQIKPPPPPSSRSGSATGVDGKHLTRFQSQTSVLCTGPKSTFPCGTKVLPALGVLIQ